MATSPIHGVQKYIYIYIPVYKVASTINGKEKEVQVARAIFLIAEPRLEKVASYA